MKELYECPCCGSLSLEEKPGKYGICDICGWEDDPIQREDPSFAGGANALSLRESREEFFRLQEGEVEE